MLPDGVRFMTPVQVAFPMRMAFDGGCFINHHFTVMSWVAKALALNSPLRSSHMCAGQARCTTHPGIWHGVTCGTFGNVLSMVHG